MITRLPWRSLMIAVLLMAFSLHTRAQETHFWEKTEGPYGIALWAAVVTADGTYFGGASLGDVYRKLPGEDRWEIVLSTEGTILTLFVYNGSVYAGDANGILAVSKDNGNTWEHENVTSVAPPQVRDLAVNQNGDLFAGTSEGVFKRTVGKDGAVMWEKKTLPTQYGSFVFSLCMDKAGTMFAGTGRGLFRSDDDGETWTLSGLAETPNSIMSLAANDEGDVYAGTSDQGLLVNYAADGEPNTWVAIGGNTLAAKQVRKVNVINGTDVFISVTSDGLYYSNNDTDWELLMELDSRGGTFFDPIADRLVTGTGSGFWVSPYTTDAFEYKQIGIPQKINRLFSYQSKLVALADSSKVYASPDQGKTWSPIFSNGEGVVTCYAEKDNEDMFFGCKGGFNGTPWIQAYIFIEYEQTRGWWSIGGFASDVKNIYDVLITANDSIYVGTDAGLYYIDSKNYESHRRSVIGKGVSILAMKQDGDGNIYAATKRGIYVSSDDGLHWQTHMLDGIAISELTLLDGHIVAATGNGLYYIESPDAEPTQITVGGKGMDITSVASDDHGHLYVAGSSGVSYAPDKEASWETQDSGVEGYRHWRLYTVDNMVYLSTNVGIYKHAYAQRAEISLSGLGAFMYNGSPRGVTATTIPADLPVTILYNGREEVPVEGGSYRVTAIVQDENYAGQRKGSILIRKAAATVTLSGVGTHFYNGSPVLATATTTPAGLPVIIHYNNKPEAPVEIGEYYVMATIDHPSYQGGAAGDLVIQDPVMGMEDPEEKLLSLYPVPAHDKLMIESKQDKIRSITVSDVMGRPVQRLEFKVPIKSHSLNVAYYPTGTLLVHIITDKHQQVIKKIQVIR
jgi:ligand-binding sensor domain-containing protein